MRIGLVLGAGGITGGAFHAGVLTALAEEVGWDARRAEVIVGTSAGSMTGAVLRAGLPSSDLAARAEGRPLSAEGRRVASGLGGPPGGFPLRSTRRVPSAVRGAGGTAALRRMAMRPWDVRPTAVLAALLPAGAVPTSMITDGLDPLFGRRWPAEAFWVCAVRLVDGRRVVFGREGAPEATVGDAVAASCAIPSYFEPVVIDGERYVDGGVHSLTNLDLAGGLGLDLVVVSSPMSQAGRTTPRATADWALRRYCRAQLDREAIGVRRRGTPVLAFQPTADDAALMGINAMDPSKRAAVSAAVRVSAGRRLRRADVADRVEILAGAAS
ncbi:MAG TPA: patatin-like phospholipase family protein [Acidimicrobiales bacterium]|nr:patatin-like phospholipase family protein [Acidimicrobiales bacterium]